MFESQVFGFLEENSTPFEAKVFSLFPSFLSITIDKYQMEWILLPYTSTLPESNLAYMYAAKQAEKGIRVIWIHQHFWVNQNLLLKNRLLSLFKNRIRIHARKCKLELVSKEIARTFLEQNHSLGFSNASQFLALSVDSNLVALASFSGPRKMTQESPVYESWELERFSSILGATVVGGMDKLIKYFLSSNKVQHLMTYSDLAWGLGNTYFKLGFREQGFKPAPLLCSYEGKLKLFNPQKDQNPIWLPGSVKFTLDLRSNEGI